MRRALLTSEPLPTVTRFWAHGALLVERGDTTRDHRPCIMAVHEQFAMRRRRTSSDERSVWVGLAETWLRAHQSPAHRLKDGMRGVLESRNGRTGAPVRLDMSGS